MRHTATVAVFTCTSRQWLGRVILLQISLEHALLRNTGPSKQPLQLGITAAAETPAGTVMLGAGDGTLALLSTDIESSTTNPKVLQKLRTLATLRLDGGITSIAIDHGSAVAVRAGRNPSGGGTSYTAYVGTDRCNMYHVRYDPLSNR